MPQLQRIDLSRMMGGLRSWSLLRAFIIAFPIGAQYWEQALLFLNSTPAGLVDPLFGKDISFYLFQYPFIDAMNTLLRVLIADLRRPDCGCLCCPGRSSVHGQVLLRGSLL